MLEKELKAYYRKIANYETDVVPAYCKLVNVDWDIVRKRFIKRQRERFNRSLYFHWREYKGAYVGPKIRRWEVLPGTKYALKLALPILIPAELDEKRLNKGIELYREVFAKMNASAKEKSADYREYLAERLNAFSKKLGRYDTRHYASSGGLSRVSTWEPDYELASVLAPEKPSMISLEPGTVGQIQVTVEQFWFFWHAFHEAEKMAVSPLLPQQIRDKTVGITPAGLRAYYLKALAHPSFVDQLTEYEVSELRAYAEDIYQDACELARDLLEGSANYPYPDEYKNGREFDYWLERQSTVAESRQIQALCDAHAKASKPSVSTPSSSGKPATQSRQGLVSEWAAVLLNLEESQLLAVVEEMGLKPTTLYTPRAAPWAGLVLELQRRQNLPQQPNAEQLVRAFGTWGVKINPGSLRNPSNAAEGWQGKAKTAFDAVLNKQ